MTPKVSKAFTLIELMVVLSVISVMTALVLAALSQSRIKARDAALRQIALQLRTEHELAFSRDGNYSAFQTTGNDIAHPADYICAAETTPPHGPSFQCIIKTAAGCSNAPIFAAQEAANARNLCKNALMNTTHPLYFGANTAATHKTTSSIYGFAVYLAGSRSMLCVNNRGVFADRYNQSDFLSKCFEDLAQ